MLAEDIFPLLGPRNLQHILLNIFQYLNADRDLRYYCSVSRKWKEFIDKEVMGNRELRQVLNYQQAVYSWNRRDGMKSQCFLYGSGGPSLTWSEMLPELLSDWEPAPYLKISSTNTIFTLLDFEHVKTCSDFEYVRRNRGKGYYQTSSFYYQECPSLYKCAIPFQDYKREDVLCFSHFDEKMVVMLMKNQCSQKLCPHLLTFIKCGEEWHRSECDYATYCDKDQKILAMQRAAPKVLYIIVYHRDKCQLYITEMFTRHTITIDGIQRGTYDNLSWEDYRHMKSVDEHGMALLWPKEGVLQLLDFKMGLVMWITYPRLTKGKYHVEKLKKITVLSQVHVAGRQLTIFSNHDGTQLNCLTFLSFQLVSRMVGHGRFILSWVRRNPWTLCVFDLLHGTVKHIEIENAVTRCAHSLIQDQKKVKLVGVMDHIAILSFYCSECITQQMKRPVYWHVVDLMKPEVQNYVALEWNPSRMFQDKRLIRSELGYGFVDLHGELISFLYKPY